MGVFLAFACIAAGAALASGCHCCVASTSFVAAVAIALSVNGQYKGANEVLAFR